MFQLIIISNYINYISKNNYLVDQNSLIILIYLLLKFKKYNKNWFFKNIKLNYFKYKTKN